MGKYNEELVKAGVMLAGEGLHPSSKGKRVRFSGGKHTIIDGPFTESKELIAGFWLWQVRSMDEAIEWLKRSPFDGGTEIEVRQVFETDDFGAELTPELREQEERLRKQTAARNRVSQPRRFVLWNDSVGRITTNGPVRLSGVLGRPVARRPTSQEPRRRGPAGSGSRL